MPQGSSLRILYALAAQEGSAYGGIEAYGRELMAGMASRGHAVDVLDTTAAIVYQDYRVIDRWPPRELRRRYYLWNRMPYEDWRFHAVLARQAAKLTSAFRPTLLHALHLHTYGVVLGSRVPSVVTAHGLEVEPIPPVVGSAQSCDAIHAVSNFTANLVNTRIKQAAPVTVITWGSHSRTSPARRATDFDLITVARLVYRKNVDTVLRALASRSHLRYAIVGDGPELPMLRGLVASLRLTNVEFFGLVSHDRRHELLDRSRAFIMCPRATPSDVEGLGLVYFEAMEAGLPIIASNNGGVPDATGTAAVLVDCPDSVDEVGGAIDAVLSSPVHERLSEQVEARRRRYSWDAFLDAFELFYWRVADGELRRSSAKSRTFSPPR